MPIRRAPLLALAALAGATTLAAQEPGWDLSGELNGSLFFGTTSQRLVGTRASVSRADSAVELSATGAFAYAEAQDAEGVSAVTKRSWLGSASLDLDPFDRWSPFFFSTVESSFEKRIALRVGMGAGAKLTVARSERGSASVSLALLGERTDPRDTRGAPALETTERLRWSLRVKGEREVGERLRLSHQTFYQPSVRETDEFLVTSTSGAAYSLNDAVRLTLTFVDTYDSEAVARGARAYNDGQLLVGIQASR